MLTPAFPVVDLPAAAQDGHAAEWRALLLDRRRRGRPTAARLRLDAAPSADCLYTVCEFLQYVDLCITDAASAAYVVFPDEPQPPAPALLTRKLFTRFAFGGIVLTDFRYACLNTPAAEALYALLRPIPAKFYPVR